MPTLPAQLTPTVAPSGPAGVFSRIDASPENFGAQSAQALGNLGSTLERGGSEYAQNALEFQAIHNETNVDQNNNGFENWKRDLLFSPEGGFYGKQGKDAIDAMQPTADAIEQKRQQVRDGLENDEQKRIFDYMSRQATRRDITGMEMHANKEAERWRMDTAKGSISTAVDNSAAYWNDDQRFAMSLGIVKVQASKLAQQQGIDPDSDAGKSIIKHYQSEAWQARIHAVMAKDPDLARELFDANRDYLDAPHAAQLEQQITSHQYTAMARDNAAVQKADAQAAKAEREVQTQHEADFMARAVSGKPPSAAELADALRTRTIAPAAYHTIIAVARGAADAPSDPRLLATFYSRLGDPTNPLTKEEVLGAAGRGLHGSAAASLMTALNAQGRREESPIERGYYASLKTALGGHNVEQGLVDLTHEAGRRDAALWSQAQAEWVNRVKVKGEDPAQVFADMMPRFQQNPAVPANLPAPRLGAVTSLQDVQGQAQQIAAHVKAGDMDESTAADQTRLLARYEAFYKDQAARQAARAPVAGKPADTSGKQKPKVKGLVAKEE